MEKRLSDNQIVIIVLALCGALVLAPVGVYAAATQKVTIVDAKSAKRAVTVNGQRQTADRCHGKRERECHGKREREREWPRVGTACAPSEPFHREGGFVSSTLSVVGAAVPAGKILALSSIQLRSTSGGSYSRVLLVLANADGSCSGNGTVLMTVANFNTNNQLTVQLTYPVPVIQAATSTGICVVMGAAMDGQVVVDGYTY